MTVTKIALTGAAMAALLLTTVHAFAQEPDEATKSWALKRAYQLNGNSMVGDKMIDLSREHPDDVVVKTQKIIPTPTPTPTPTPEKHADASAPSEAPRQQLAKPKPTPAPATACTRSSPITASPGDAGDERERQITL